MQTCILGYVLSEGVGWLLSGGLDCCYLFVMITRSSRSCRSSRNRSSRWSSSCCLWWCEAVDSGVAELEDLAFQLHAAERVPASRVVLDPGWGCTHTWLGFRV